MVERLAVGFVAFVLILACATPSHAELAYFQSGRTMSIKEHHLDGASLVLTLRNGGQIVCEPSMIARFAPDEVPYPEPEPMKAAVAPAITAHDGDVTPYAKIIDKVAAEQGVPAKLVRAVIRVVFVVNQYTRDGPRHTHVRQQQVGCNLGHQRP